MLGLVHVAHGDLMRTPVVLAFLAVDLLRAGPALRRAKDDHRPGRAFQIAVVSGVGPNPLDLRHRGVEHAGQLLVDIRRVVALDEVGRIAHALEELPQFLLGDAGEEARVGDLVAVEVKDRQHAAVAGRVQELVAVPARRERPGLGLAVADDAGDDQVLVVEGRAIGMAQRIAEFAAFMNAARRFRSNVAGNATGEAELLEQPLHALRVLTDIRIDFAVGAFQIGVSNQGRAAMPRPDDVDHVEVVALDDPVKVDVEHIQARRRAPVAEQPWFDVLALQRLFQQRVFEQVDLADGQIVGRSPVGIHRLQFPGGKWGAAGQRFLASGMSFFGCFDRSHDSLPQKQRCRFPLQRRKH